jgi:hypothetical protein
MYAPNNHTCSAIPLWRVIKKLGFILVSMEKKRKKLKFLIRVEKSDMAGFKNICFY